MPVIVKHIIYSNILLLILPLISLYFSPYSNQTQLYYEKYIRDIREFDHFESIEPMKDKSLTNASDLMNTNAINEESSIKKIAPMPLFSRYILAHCQFDGLQFLLNQYQYQPNFAFIKGYTTLIGFIQQILQSFQLDSFQLNPFLCLIISLIIVNKILFSISSLILYQLVFNLKKDHKKSFIASILFLYNPACIFFHSVYTESIYTFLTFSAILLLSKFESLEKFQYLLSSLMLLSLSVTFRTNGIFLSTIYGVEIISQLWLKFKHQQYFKALRFFFKGFVILTIILVPLILYQLWCYDKICSSEIDIMNDSSLQKQCSKLLPNLYSWIQHKYWSVGFFSYWTPSNLVFILFGLPALIVGFNDFKYLKKQLSILLSVNTNKQKSPNDELVSFSLYLSFVILYLITFSLTNVQSSTRFFSSHPLFYLILAQQILNKKDWIKYWIGSYLIVGSILFCIGFPWT